MKARMVLCAGALGVVGVLGFFAATRGPSQGPVPTTPYTLYMYERASSADGSRVLERYFFDVVASDGSRAGGNYLPQPDGGVRFLARNIRRASDGSRVVTHEGAGVKTTWYAGALKTLRTRPPSDPTCRTPWPGFRLVGEEDAYGFKSVKWVYRSSDSTYVWVAPELGCAKIAARIEGRNENGSLRAITTQQPLAFVRGEPDGSFFDLSKTYVESRPSEFYARSLEAERPGAGPASSDVKSKLKKQDQQYQRSQADKP